MDTPANTQHSPQTAKGMPLDVAAAAQADLPDTDNIDPLKQKKEQEQQDDKEPEETPDTLAANSAAESPAADANVEQLDDNGFARPRPVTDYLKDDDSLPGWVWTLGGVALITGLDALDNDDSEGNSNNTPNNTAPQFSTDTLTLDSVAEDGSSTFTVDVEDAEGDSLSFSRSDPANGTITQGDEDAQFIYTPEDNFFGDDSFIIAVRDPSGATDTLTVNVTVTPENDAPQVAANRELSTKTGIALAFDVEATDIDDDTLNFSVGEGGNAPQNGSVDAVNANGDFTYTPDAGFTGEDSFQIIVSDGESESTQTVTVNVKGILTVTANDVSVDEGAENTTAMVFTLTIDSAQPEDLILSVGQSGGSATAEEDFSPLAETVTLTAGQTSVDYVVNILGDILSESDETIELTFNSTQLAAPLIVTGTIIDDDVETTLALSAADDSGAANDDGLTQVQAMTLIVTSATGADVEILSGEQSLGMATEDSENSGTYSFLTSDLDEGSYQFSATASQNGSILASSLPLSVTVDLSSPTLTEFIANADDDTVALTFSEAIDFLDATSITFLQDDNSIAAILDSIDGNTATFSFQADLVDGSLIDLAIADNSVADLAGNLLAGFDFMDDPNAITV
ncbi:tandem-95 repeat protein [Zhongshania sp.]|jgi:hypothetical protein|uniref:tandem-95 repeat protein n=1 Tax=Zhongshania sp. TaxID=1971902 RepID=UPI0039E66511